jgi:MFS family permease
MSIITMGFTFGVALGTLSAGILANTSFALPFIVGGAASIIAALAIIFYVHETPATQAVGAD